MYVVLPATPSTGATANAFGIQAAASLQTWNGSFVYGGKTYTYNMVGGAPAGNSSTTIPTYVIPVKITVVKGTVTSTFDPSHVLSNNNSVTTNTVNSPIFDATTTYTTGGVTGKTQYIDAYQRANFWGTVKTDSNYHVLLGGPTILAEQSLTVPSSYGTTGAPFGHTVGEVDINWIDAQLQSMITKLGIQPNAFPIFLLYDVYLTQNKSCCIGGYHSAIGAHSYAEATYIDSPGAFAQDVSALSHEVGEWLTDPLVANPNGNQTPCGILEVGDPLENNSNYGAFPYTVNGFTYNLQDLVMMPYFGAPASTSVNGYFTFHGQSLKVCQNGS